MKQHASLVILAALCAVLLPACATSGPRYSEAMQAGTLAPKKGKGLVLTYWTPGFAGSAGEFHVYANDQNLGPSVRRGSFVSYDADPGPLMVAIRGKMNVGMALATAITAVPTAGITLAAAGAHVAHKHKNPDVIVNAGQTHFMRLSPGAFSMKLKEVPAEKGEKEIKNCHWRNPSAN